MIEHSSCNSNTNNIKRATFVDHQLFEPNSIMVNTNEQRTNVAHFDYSAALVERHRNI